MERIRVLCKNLSDEEFEAFTLLYNESENNSTPHSPKEAREIRKNLEASLDQIGIEKSHLIARKLQEIQINSLNDPLLILSKSAEFKKIIELLNELKSLKINNAVINLSVDKASRTVKALKLFMHSEEKETNESFSLLESIETILTIYSNELKKGIELEFNSVNFNQLIRGHQDSINQVWANLIVNACQAMNFKGKLILNCEQIEGNFSLISIQDNGPGIPEVIQPRIFSPFFSTKEKGIGSGVGLSIVKQIIKREGGEIWFESSEQTGTTFFVKLKNVV
jgi:signal transduction histidine kinase